MNDWNLGKGEWRDSNPMGKRVQEFILENCEFVIYLRKDHKFKCPIHWSGPSDSPNLVDIDCWCWGFGEKISATIVPARLSRGRNAEVGFMDGSVKDIPGYLPTFTDVIHFPRPVAPQVNDVILCCEWNVKAQYIDRVPKPRPVAIHSIYMIKQINPYFQRELGWFSCGSESFEIEQDHIDQLISDKLINLSVMDVVSEWQQNSYW